MQSTPTLPSWWVGRTGATSTHARAQLATSLYGSHACEAAVEVGETSQSNILCAGFIWEIGSTLTRAHKRSFCAWLCWEEFSPFQAGSASADTLGNLHF